MQLLETKYGKVLVARALSYLTAAKEGLSDLELDDLLSIGTRAHCSPHSCRYRYTDDDALDDFYQYWTPSFRRMPTYAWSALKTDLSRFLVQKWVN